MAPTGIGATTGVAVALISPRPAQRAAACNTQLEERRSVLADGLTDIDTLLACVNAQLGAAPGDPTFAALLLSQQQRRAARVAELNRVALERAAVSPERPSGGSWRDPVTDDRGSVALDRLQMVVWTLLLSGL